MLIVIFCTLSLLQSERRKVSMSESVASTTTAVSEEDVSSSEEDNGDGDDSDTTSAPSPTPLPTEEGVCKEYILPSSLPQKCCQSQSVVRQAAHVVNFYHTSEITVPVGCLFQFCLIYLKSIPFFISHSIAFIGSM